MSTSLRSQLNQIAEKSHALHDFLERKSTVAYGPKAVVPSILFDAREAADQDPEFVYDLAMNGIDELANSHGWWKAYRLECEDRAKNVSFGSGPRIDRSLMTLEENEKLNAELHLALQALSPFLLLKPAQKVLEFLIRRLRVHEMNMDALLLCALPYHETPLFHRIICTLHLKTQPRWSFLEPAQKSESPLPRSFLAQRCLIDTSLLAFLNAHLRSIVDNKLLVRHIPFHVHMSFYACLFIETLQAASPQAWQEKNLAWLSLLLHALAAPKPTADWQLTLYAILIRLLRRMDLTMRLVNTFDLQPSQKEETLVSIVMTILARTCLPENAFQCTVLIAFLCGATESMADMTELPVKTYVHMIKWKNWTRLLNDIWQKYHAERFLKLFMATLGSQCKSTSSALPYSVDTLKEFLANTTLPDPFLHVMLLSATAASQDASAVTNQTVIDAVELSHPHIVASLKGQHEAKLATHLATNIELQLSHTEASQRLAALQQLHHQLTASPPSSLSDTMQEALAKWPFLKSSLLLRMSDENEKVSLAALAPPFQLMVDPQAFLALSHSLFVSGSWAQKKAVLACLVHAAQHGSATEQLNVAYWLMEAVYLACQRKSSSAEKDVSLLLETCESASQQMKEFKGLFKNIKSSFGAGSDAPCPTKWIHLLATLLSGQSRKDVFLDTMLTTLKTRPSAVVAGLVFATVALCSTLPDLFLEQYIAWATTTMSTRPMIQLSRWIDDKAKAIHPSLFTLLQKASPEARPELLGSLALESILVTLKARPAAKDSATALYHNVYVALVCSPAAFRAFYLPLFFAIPTIQASNGAFLIPYWSHFETSLIANVSISLWLAHAKASLAKNAVALDYQALLPFCLAGLAAPLADYPALMKHTILDILQWLLACYEQGTKRPLWGHALDTPLSMSFLVPFLSQLLKGKKEMAADGSFFIAHLQRVLREHCNAQQQSTFVSWMSAHAAQDNQTSLVVRVKMHTWLLPLLAPFQTKESLEKYQSLFVASLALVDHQEAGLGSVAAPYLTALLSVYDGPNGALLIKSLTSTKSRPPHFQCLLDVLKSSQQTALIQIILQFFSRHWTALKAWHVPVLDIVLDRLTTSALPSSLLKEWLSQLDSVPGRLVQKRLEACLAKLHLPEESIGLGVAKKSKSSQVTTALDMESAIALFEILELITLSDGYTLIPLLFEALQLSLPSSSASSSSSSSSTASTSFSSSHALRLEYYRQLTLACLEKIFTRLHSEQHIQLEENALRVDSLVSLLRSSNVASLPTQRHALLALAALAPLAPRLALSAIFPIFIFMGSLSSSSSSKVDDMYTLSLIEQTIATLLPIILKACPQEAAGSAMDTSSTHQSQNDHENEFTMSRVVSMFVESFGHIPAHRRLVLFQGLVESISTTGLQASVERALAHVIGALASRVASTGQKKHDVDMIEFMALLLAEYEWQDSLAAQIRCLLAEAMGSSQPAVFLGSNGKRHGSVLIAVLESYLSQVALDGGLDKTSSQFALFQELLSSLMQMHTEFKSEPDALRSFRASLALLWSPQWLSASQATCFFEQFVLVAGSELSVQSLGLSLLTMRVTSQSASCSRLYCSTMSHLLAHVKQSRPLVTMTGSLEKEHMSLLFKLLQAIVQSDSKTKSELESKTLLALLDDMLSGPMPSTGMVFEDFVAVLGSLFDWLQMKALPKLASLLKWLLSGLNSSKRLLPLLQLSGLFVHHYGPCLSSAQLGGLLDALLSSSVAAWSLKDTATALTSVYDRLLESVEPRTLLPALVDKAQLLGKQSGHPVVWQSYFKLLHGMLTKPSLLSQILVSYPTYLDDLLSVYTDYGLVVRVALASDASDKRDMIDSIEGLVTEALVAQCLKLTAPSFKVFFGSLTEHIFATYGKTATSPIWYTFFSLLTAYFQKFQALFLPFYLSLLPQLLPLMSALGPLLQTKLPTWNVAMTTLRTCLELGPSDTVQLANVLELLILSLSQVSVYTGASKQGSGLSLYEKRCEDHVIPCLVALVVKTVQPDGSGNERKVEEEGSEVPEVIPEIIKMTHDALISRLARHPHPSVRVQCIHALMAIYPLIDCGLLLLQETLPALAEWMEDEQPTVEKAARDFITSVEQLLGEETIQSYLA